jgi:hypothetical protein
MSSYEAKRLLNLVEDSAAYETYETTSIVSDNKFEVSESTWKSSHPHQLSTTSLTRTNSDISLYAPVRRRSIIQTPGVATRSAMPTPALSAKSSFRHSHTGTPSHSRHNSMESASYRVLSMPPRLVDPDSVERVVTPCESEYKQLGAMRFGSLRITNGTASPVPSPESERHRPKAGSDKASTTSGRDEDVVERRSQSSLVSEASRKKKKNTKVMELKEPKPLSRLLSPLTTTFLRGDFVSNRSSSLLKSSTKTASPPKPAPEEPKGDYLAEIHFSPFSITDSRPATPELQTTSKHTALEDNLFDVEDDAQTEYSALEILHVREDSYAKPRMMERPRPDPAQKSTQSVARSDSGFISSPTSEYSHANSHKPLSKADSGYSSNVSLRSFQSSKPPVPEKDFPPMPVATEPAAERSDSRSSFLGDFRLPSPTFITLEDVKLEAPSRMPPPPPPTPPKDVPSVSPTKLTHSAPVAVQHIALMAAPPGSKRSRQVPAPIDSSRTSDGGLHSPEAQLSPASSDTSTSALSIGSGSHRPGKLQRLLSGAGMRGPPSVHVTHPVHDTIPSVPHDVQQKLHEHTGLFPITTKRLALRTESSKETLKTIFSVGSVEVAHAEDPHRLSRAMDEMGAQDRKPVRRRSLQSVTASISHVAHAAAAVIPRKPVHRKPVTAKDHDKKSGHAQKRDDEKDTVADTMDSDFEAAVTSMDCIRNSIGNSAFDQAVFAAMAEERDAYFSPTGRTVTMTAQLERDMELRLARSKAQTSSPRLLDAASPTLSPLMPDMLSPLKSGRTQPPVSLRTRSVRNLRVPPPLRPQSDPLGRSQSLSRKSSRESIHSYPQASPSGRDEQMSPPEIPPMNPRRRSLSGRDQQLYPAQHSAPVHQSQQEYDNWRASRTPSRRGSVSSQSESSESPRFRRPASATPYDQQQRRNVPPPLRHRSSYDGFNPNYPPSSHDNTVIQDPWMAAQYRQRQQQRERERELRSQLGGGWDQQQQQQQSRQPPYVPRLNHHRNRSHGSRHGQPGNPPYRILHSYNSPAYRNVPIWG